MSMIDVLYPLAYYTRDLVAFLALGASVLLALLGLFRASAGLALRNAATRIGFLALVAGVALSAVPLDRGYLLSRLTAVEILTASVIVWLFSVLLQGYYGK